MTPPPREIFDRLTRLDDLQRRAREGTLHTLLPELDAAVAALGADPAAESLRVLRMALRVDLAFLAEHPEAMFACLYNRCIWHEAPEADAYYDLPGGQLAAPAPAAPAGGTSPVDPLHALMARWRAEIEAGGAPWLRSLRPPEVWLHGALLEEYRGEAPQYFRRPRLTEDGRVQLAYGPRERGAPTPFAVRAWNSLLWDRATGRRLEGPIVALRDEEVSPDGALRVKHETWGEANLLDYATGASIGRLALSDSRNASSVAWSADGRLVALSGWDDDGGGFLVVYDVETRAPVMDLDVGSSLFELAIAPGGDRVAASGSRATFVWEVATARKLRTLPLRHAALAFSPDARHLVTAELGVVRVWDVAEGSAFLRGYREGLSGAAFSPDGERLVTGSWLVDARTGALVAHLDFESVEYLEGGPPRNAFVLGDARMVCLERGAEVWDARTGARLLEDRSRRYAHWHLTALSPSGDRYALTHAHRADDTGDATVTILDTDTGATLAETTTSAVTSMAWAPDGRTLATGSVDGQVRLWDGIHGGLLRTLAGHPRAVSDLAFLRGGSCLVSGAEDDAARFWHVDTGAAIRARPLGEGDPSLWRSSDVEGCSHRTWTASADAVDEESRWLDERADTSPWKVEPRAGSLAAIDQRTGHPLAWLPASEDVRRHPSEPVWAGGPVHVRLEGRLEPSRRG